MTSARELGGEGAAGGRACTTRIRGRATPSWTSLIFRCRRERKARTRIVIGYAVSASPAKVRETIFHIRVNVNGNRNYFSSLSRRETSGAMADEKYSAALSRFKRIYIERYAQ